MGGDEFVITAPGLTAEAAKEKAERLNQAAIESGRHVCGRDLITLSVGMAFCPEDGFDVERLLAEADRRMYSMKQVHHAAAAAREDTKARGPRRNRRHEDHAAAEHAGAENCTAWTLLVATVLLGGFLSATLVRLAPGFDVDEAATRSHLNSESVQALRQARLEQHNIFRFYFHSLQRAAHGDLGTSLSLGQPVSTLLRERAPLTLRLVAIGLLLSWAAAMALALSAAWLRVSAYDALTTVSQRNVSLHSRGGAGAVVGAVERPRSSWLSP